MVVIHTPVPVTRVEGLRTDSTAYGPVALCKGCLRVVTQFYHAVPTPKHEDGHIWKEYKGRLTCKNSWRQAHCNACGHQLAHWDKNNDNTSAPGVHFAVAQYIDTHSLFLPWTWETGYWEVRDFHLYTTSESKLP